MEIRSIQEAIRSFVNERDWERFHRPSALALSIAVEVGELLELFQWRTDVEVSEALQSDDFRNAMSDEIADVLIYLLRLADVVGIDPVQAFLCKMDKNARKYPVSRFRGSSPHQSRTFE